MALQLHVYNSQEESNLNQDLLTYFENFAKFHGDHKVWVLFAEMDKFKGPIMEFLDIFESRPLVFTPSIYPCSITGKFFRVGDHLFFFQKYLHRDRFPFLV